MTASTPDPNQPHVVGHTRRVLGSAMFETSCTCGTTVHDLTAEASAAALDDHRAAGAERAAKLAADVPSFTPGGAGKP